MSEREQRIRIAVVDDHEMFRAGVIATSAACPTTSKYGCNVAITPARNISWSSTTAILMRCSRSLIPAPWFD